MSKITILYGFLAFSVGACATSEILTPYAAVVPAGINLSGDWLINKVESENYSRALRGVSLEPDEMEAVMKRSTRQRPISDENDQSRARRHASSGKDRGLGGMLHYFLRMADELSVEQTRTALFMNFNRAVVKEYRFGEQRELERSSLIVQRVSGWDAENYVIETLHPKGSKITERYYLSAGGARLHRQILLRGKRDELVSFVQVFDRKSGRDH